MVIDVVMIKDYTSEIGKIESVVKMKDNVLGEFFDVDGCNDVYVTFTGLVACSLKDGKKNPLYGRTVNISKMYKEMMRDIIEYVQSDEYLKGRCNGSDDKYGISESVTRFTTKKYGISIEFIDDYLNNSDNKDVRRLSVDRLFELMIEESGGVDKIDWLKIYDSVTNFYTSNEKILMYIANTIINTSEIYKYFINRYKLKVVDVTRYERKRGVHRHIERCVKLKWDCGELNIELSRIVRNKSDWYKIQTRENKGRRSRKHIKNMDELLRIQNKSEDEMFPDRCPIDSRIVLNYTGIDFSAKKDNNITECKSLDFISDDTWSAASLDRIDSNSDGYDYENIEVMSHYYNTSVKNCATVDQTARLFFYQTFRQINSFTKTKLESLGDEEFKKILGQVEQITNMLGVMIDSYKDVVSECERRNKID